jgi:hypothetical protein
MELENALKSMINEGLEHFHYMQKQMYEIEEDTLEKLKQKAIAYAIAIECTVEILRPSFKIAPSLFPEKDIKKEIKYLLDFQDYLRSFRN